MPATTPPATAPVCDLDDVPLAVVVVRFAVISTTGALRKVSQSLKKTGFSPNTNLRANGAYIAPCAGLVEASW